MPIFQTPELGDGSGSLYALLLGAELCFGSHYLTISYKSRDPWCPHPDLGFWLRYPDDDTVPLDPVGSLSYWELPISFKNLLVYPAYGLTIAFLWSWHLIYRPSCSFVSLTRPAPQTWSDVVGKVWVRLLYLLSMLSFYHTLAFTAKSKGNKWVKRSGASWTQYNMTVTSTGKAYLTDFGYFGV